MVTTDLNLPSHAVIVKGSPTVAYAPPEILFEIIEITRFSKSEIKKIDMVTSTIL